MILISQAIITYRIICVDDKNDEYDALLTARTGSARCHSSLILHIRHSREEHHIWTTIFVPLTPAFHLSTPAWIELMPPEIRRGFGLGTNPPSTRFLGSHLWKINSYVSFFDISSPMGSTNFTLVCPHFGKKFHHNKFMAHGIEATFASMSSPPFTLSSTWIQGPTSP